MYIVSISLLCCLRLLAAINIPLFIYLLWWHYLNEEDKEAEGEDKGRDWLELSLEKRAGHD